MSVVFCIDRFGIAKIRKIDRVAVRVGELTLERIDFAPCWSAYRRRCLEIASTSA